MDELDAITLLYLSKNWDGQGTLLDCMHAFRQTKKELAEAIKDEQGGRITERLGNGTFNL